jgi:hypothetical protein
LTLLSVCHTVIPEIVRVTAQESVA